MKRLLLRSALALVAFLAASATLYTVLTWDPLIADRREEIQGWADALTRSVAAELSETRDADRDARIEALASETGWPVRVTTEPAPSIAPGDVLSRARIGETDDWLQIGPVPLGPLDRVETMGWVSLGFDVVLIALIAAWLAWPLWRGHRKLGETARAVQNGDLAARVNLPARSPVSDVARAFDAMAATTEAMVARQRDLLRAVSHELRTPIARLRFAVPAVVDEGSDEERALALAAIDRDLDELDELVAEIIAFSQLADGSDDLEPESVDLAECAESLVDKYPTIDVVESEPASVQAVPRLLMRALDNLVRNAVRHATERVTLRWRVSDDATVIYVDDDGPGVPEADRARVFEPFVRMTGDGGHGLGLAIVDRVARSHGGRVWIEESSLGGASFALELPTRRPS